MRGQIATFQCAACHGVFPLGDHDRAMSEATRICAGVKPEDRVIVCDACFEVLRELMGVAAGPVLQ